MDVFEKRFIKNIEFFNSKNKKLIEKLVNSGIVNENVRIEKNGQDFDVYFLNTKIGTILTYAQIKIDTFFKYLTYLLPPLSVAGSPLTQKIEKEVINKYTKKMLTIEQIAKNADSLIVLGTLPFFHLEELLKKTTLSNLKNLYLFEAQIEIFYLSLFMLDYDHLFQIAKSNGIELYFYLHEEGRNYDAVFVDKLMSTLFKKSVVPITKSYDSQVMDKLENELVNTFTKFRTLVPTETIIKGVKNIAANITNRHFLFEPTKKERDTPIVIVGSGPSLDDNIEFLQRNQDRLYIFALNTAASLLVKNEIMPDFIINIDSATSRNIHYANIPEDMFKKSFFFYTLNTQKDLVDMFDHKALISYGSFDDILLPKPPTKSQGSTVAVKALEVALKMGFETILFLGVDLAVKNTKETHSSHYKFAKKEVQDLIEVRGNFREKVFTTFEYINTLKPLEQLIQKNIAGHNYYNLSDGAYIDGAIPKRFQELKFDTIKRSPSLIVRKRILKNFRIEPQVAKVALTTLEKFLIIGEQLLTSFKEENIDLLSKSTQAFAELFNMKDGFAFKFFYTDILFFILRIGSYKNFFQNPKDYVDFVNDVFNRKTEYLSLFESYIASQKELKNILGSLPKAKK